MNLDSGGEADEVIRLWMNATEIISSVSIYNSRAEPSPVW